MAMLGLPSEPIERIGLSVDRAELSSSFVRPSRGLDWPALTRQPGVLLSKPMEALSPHLGQAESAVSLTSGQAHAVTRRTAISPDSLRSIGLRGDGWAVLCLLELRDEGPCPHLARKRYCRYASHQCQRSQSTVPVPLSRYRRRVSAACPLLVRALATCRYFLPCGGKCALSSR
ncbi:hypothetical protein D9M68_794170 [compost metagenome]